MSRAEMWGERRFESHADFYAEVYGHADPKIVSVGRTGAVAMLVEQDAGDWSDAPTPDLIVSCVAKGRIQVTSDVGAGRTSNLHRPGNFLVIPPESATTVLCDAPHQIKVVAVPYRRLLDLAGDDCGLPTDGDFGAVHVRLQSDARVASLVDDIWREANAGGIQPAIWFDGALLQLGAALLCLRDGSERQVGLAGLAPWQLRRAVERMGELEGDVSLAELAADVGLSANHFCTAFRRSTGLPPHRWIVVRRIERAKAMLLDSRTGITAIALACGFGSSAHFATTFRKHVGVSPSAWRRERMG